MAQDDQIDLAEKCTTGNLNIKIDIYWNCSCKNEGSVIVCSPLCCFKPVMEKKYVFVHTSNVSGVQSKPFWTPLTFIVLEKCCSAKKETHIGLERHECA